MGGIRHERIRQHINRAPPDDHTRRVALLQIEAYLARQQDCYAIGSISTQSSRTIHA